MEGGPRAQYNPYEDLFANPGREAFARLLNAEVYFMVPQSYSNNEKYKRDRRSAVAFIENNERNLQYSARNVLDMELHICERLEWRMRTLTPFCFVEYFIPILRLTPNLPTPRRPVRQLIVKSQFDISFTVFRPSVVAASAMLTISSKMFPAQHSLFELNIITSEFIRPLKDMVLKCNKELAPLYRDPSMPEARDTSISIYDTTAGEGPGLAERKPAEPNAAPGEGSGSVERKRSDPIPVPGRTSPSAETQIKSREMSEALWMAALPPGANIEEERMRRAGKEPAVEEEWTRRAGKEPAASEIHPEPEENRIVVQDEADELMNFELGWIEAQADAQRRDEARAGGEAGYGTYFMQKLTDCCTNFMRGCNIL
ncbi:hypothetical protein Pfo_014187 [Paulownia fortunei]|nr:hypothetical protein Pfo_014187 [Paulownia fortunei]